MIRLNPRPNLGVRSFVVSGLAALLSSGAPAAYALPSGFSVAGPVGGAALGAGDLTHLTVDQTSNRVVINWGAFNIGSGQTVTFNQPSKSSIAFNVINPTSLTTINGSLQANGGVWLFSPAGIIFGAGSTVNVGSFLASTGMFKTDPASLNTALNSNSIQIFPQATPGAASIDVQSGATINAIAGFVLLNAPTITQAGDVTASDAVAYNADEDVQVQFAPTGTAPNDSILLTNESSFIPTPSASHIDHTGSTTAGTWFEVDAAQDVTTSPSFGGVINLSGHVIAKGMKADTLDPTDKANGYSVILNGDDPVNTTDTTSVTTIDGSAGSITAASGIIGSAGTIKTGQWISNGGAVSLLGAGPGIDVDQTLVSNGSGAVDLVGQNVAVNAGVTAAGSLSILSFATQVAPGVTVQAGRSIAGSSLILKSTGDISADPSSTFLVGPSASTPNGSLSITAGATIRPSDSFLVDSNFAATGGDLSLGAVSAGSVALQASPVNGVGGAVTIPGAVNATGSVLIGASQLNLGPDASITAGFTGGSNPGVITTSSATSNVQVWNTSATFAPTAQAAAGDVLLGAPVSISDPNYFAINAYHSITVTAPITDSGVGEVDLNPGQGGGGGDYGFTNGGALTFTAAPNSGQSLFINGYQYTLLYTQDDLLSINDPNNGSGGLNGLYALAAPLDFDTGATGTVFTGAPIASTTYAQFTGTFTGLGNTISNLNIQEVTPIGQSTPNGGGTNGAIGLFGFIGSSGLVRDLNLSNASVTGGDGIRAGALVGNLDGTVMNVSSSGQVAVGSDTFTSTGLDYSDFAQAFAGGLVGFSDGQIINAHSSATVMGGQAAAGGLVGQVANGGSIANSSASGSVTVAGVNPIAGGLVGAALYSVTITGSSASGAVSGGDNTTVGGLVGELEFGSSASGSFATGATNAGANSEAGGFAGLVIESTIDTSYATGAVTQTAGGFGGLSDFAGGFVGELEDSSSITRSYSSGAVQTVAGADSGSFTFAGGFVGAAEADSTVSNAYSLGAVTVTGGAFADTGGFAGVVEQNSTVSGFYATGHVTGSGTTEGLVAVVGDGDPNSGPPTNAPRDTSSISDGYWDEGTTGQTGLGYTLLGTATTAPRIVGIGAGTTYGAYATATYGNFGTDLTTGAGTWVMIPGETRPMLSSEYSTTIPNAHQLQLMELHPGADYILANDIDASGTSNAAGLAGGLWNPATGFSPVGGNGEALFTGIFDGQGHSISGLSINYIISTPQSPVPGLTTDGTVGLFGLVGPAGVIEDVNLVDANVVGGDGMLVGPLVGGLLGTVDYASSSQSPEGSALVQVGDETASNVTADAGGLVGGSAGLIANSHAAVTVRGGEAFAGGLLGTGGEGGLVSNSYATGAVSVGDYIAGREDNPNAGGLVGEVGGSNGSSNAVLAISGSYATGSVTGGAGASIGGLVGSVGEVTVADSYATGAVTQSAGGANGSNSAAGGFVGSLENGGQIHDSYASGDVISKAATANNFTRAGGFAGEIEGEGTGVYNAYALGSVTINGSGAGVSPAGGFAGAIDGDGEADHVYATGLVTGPGAVGGLAGQVGAVDNGVSTGGSIFDSYWDQGTTGQSVGAPVVGAGTQFENTAVGGTTGPSPYATTTYTNFKLNSDWFMIPGETRPILRSEYSTSISNVHQLELMSLNLGASYALANNIDAGETTSASGVFNPANGFVPVGANAATPFTGTFSGQGYSISHLTLIAAAGGKQTVDGVTTTGAVGLFGFAGAAASIGDVTIANSHATGGDGMSVGLLVGSLSGTVSDASSFGSVTVGNGVDPAGGFANAAAGGLVGSLSATGSVNFSWSSASVTGGQASVGGLVGEMDGGSILTSYATGCVTVGAGGATGTQIPAAGGLVGAALVTGGATPTISGSYATGGITAGGSSDAGGFIGLSQGTITTSYATGTVLQAASSFAPDLAGGFAGEISGGAVSQSFSTGSVTVSAPSAEAEVGGFVGEVVNGGVITNAYSTSPTSVTGCLSNVGGFAGEILDTSSATDFYAAGCVTSNAHAAGLVGRLSGTISNGYWDTGATNQGGAVYNSTGGSENNIVGMVVGGPNDPFTKSTYAGFDFNSIWSTPSNGVYPQLYGASHVLQVTASNDTITYGNFPAYTVTATGLQAGDTFASAVQTFQVGPLLNPPGIASSGYYDVGSYGLSVSGVTAAGPAPQSGPYQIIYNDPGDYPTNDGGTLFINPAALTISATPDSMTYDGSAQDTGPNSTPGVGGLVPGDSVLATQSYDGANAGSHTLSVDDGYSVNDGNYGNNYTVDASGTAAGFINQLALTASLTGTVDKTYDGTTDATLTSQNYTLSPGISGDNVSLNFVTSGTYDTQDVGSGKTVSVTGLTLTGDSASNYTVNFDASGPVGQIDKADLTLSAVGDTKTYDGTTLSTGTPGESGLAASDTLGSLSQSFFSKDVLGPGCSTLVVNSGYTITELNGSDGSGNYNVTTDSASGTINAVDVVLSANTDTKTYDGGVSSSASPTLNILYTAAGDTLSATQSFASKDVKGLGGSTLVVDPGYSINDGNGGADYNIIQVNPASGTINPLALTASLQGTVEKTYDGTTVATLGGTNYSLSSPIGQDNVSLNNPTSGTYDTQNVGSGKTVTVTGLQLLGNDAEDYTVNSSASNTIGIIDQADLTLSAVFDTKTYDGTTLSSGTPGQSGLAASDTLGSLSQSFTSKDVVVDGCSTLVVNSGYTITESNGSDGSGNYKITTEQNSGIITPVDVVLSATGDTKTYDGGTTSLASPTLSILYTSAGDTLSATQSFASKDAKGTGGSTLVVNPGYSIDDGNGGADYNITQVNTASGTINPLALTASLTGTVEKTYDGTTGATLGSTNYSLSSAIGGDSVSLNNPTSGTFDNRNAGTGKTVSVTGLQLAGADAEDYTVNNTAQAAIGIIDRAALTLTAVTDTKTYDGTLLSNAAPTHSSLVAGDSISGLTEAYDSRNAGSRTLSISGYTINDGNDGGNYIVTTVIAPGTINAAPLTLAAVTDKKNYDGTTTSTARPDITGLVGSDSGVATQAFDSKDAGARTLSVVGYTINDGNDGGNYIVTTTTAAGTITASTQPIVVDLPPTDVVPPDFDQVAAIVAGSTASTTTVVNVFPVGSQDPAQAGLGDSSPITGAGNRDLWTSSDESDKTCPPNTTCPANGGTAP
jgi:filamentous hemagglutinin family protein